MSCEHTSAIGADVTWTTRLAMTSESRSRATVDHDVRCDRRLRSLVCSAVLLLLLLLLSDNVSGHGRLVEPPSRASMWRYGYSTEPDFHDNQLWCGGFKVCAVRLSDSHRMAALCMISQHGLRVNFNHPHEPRAGTGLKRRPASFPGRML